MTKPKVVRSKGKPRAGLSKREWASFLVNRRKAHDRGNWSDGGHWIGSGRKPDAWDAIEVSSSGVLMLEWPSDDCVHKYRTQRSKMRERLSYMVGALVGAATAKGSMLVGLGAGFGSSWLLNQIPAQRIHRGWRYICVTSLKVKVSAHPWGRNRLSWTRTEYIFDHKNKLHKKRETSGGRKIEDSLIRHSSFYPFLRSVSTQAPTRVRIICPDASVLSP